MRIRTVKPEFWLHEGLCGCSEFTRLLALALLNWSDDEGYFMANPSLLRGNLFPFLDSSKTIPGSLSDLSRVGWIELSTDDQNRSIGRVVNFSKHQRVDKPKPSIIKGLWTIQDASKTDLGFIQDASKEERKGKEGNGGGGGGGGGGGKESPPPPLDFPEPPPFNPNRIATFEQVKKFAEGQMPPVASECYEAFFDRMESEGWITKEGHPLNDWRARFRTWAGAWQSNAAKPNLARK